MKTDTLKTDSQRQIILVLSHFVKIISLILIVFSIFGCANLFSENNNSRIRAVNKLSDQNILYKVALDDRSYLVQEKAIKKLSQSLLAKLTTESNEVVVRLYAIDYLTDQKELMNISQNNDNWKVRKEAYKKLNDNSLDLLTKESKDPALSLAAMIQLGRISWNKAFSGINNSSISLGDIIGAAALVDSPQPTSIDIVTACHNFIRLGDVTRIPELRNLLLRYGDITLAEDYLNCGRSELADAGREWGRAHGYNIKTGLGSNRVRWGEK